MSQHTESLSFDKAQQDIERNYHLAVEVSRNLFAAASGNRPLSCRKILSSFHLQDLSIAKVLLALAKKKSEAKSLKYALNSIGLDFYYDADIKTFALYEEGMPFYEYITGCYQYHLPSDSGKIKIIKDDLPDTLKNELVDALFEFGFTASKRRRCPKRLKKITSKVQYGCKIPLVLLNFNRPDLIRKDSYLSDESDQQVVAVYYRLYKRLFNSRGEEIATIDSLNPPSSFRQENLAGWLQGLGHLSEGEIERILNAYIVMDMSSTPVSEPETDLHMTLEVQPTILQSDKQQQGEKLAELATLILFIQQTPKLQLGHFAIEYDSKRGRLKVEDQRSHQSILAAHHELNFEEWTVPEQWNVDPIQTEITDDFVQQLLGAWHKFTSLMETKDRTSSNQILEDVRALERLEANSNKRLSPNSMLAGIAISKGYEPARIKRILIHSQHTKSLSSDEAQKSIDDGYRLALVIKPSWTTLAVKNVQSSSTCFGWGEFDEDVRENEYIEKIDISITDIIIGLLRETTTASRLRKILAEFELTIKHDLKTGVFTIYELGNPYQEYVCACWTDSGLEIISDYLPKALKQEIFPELSKIEIPRWLPEYFDSRKFLKHRALRKGKNHYHPFALVSIEELRLENELPASAIGQEFERAKELASGQELVFTYSASVSARPLEPIELDADLPNSNDSELTVAESANNSPPPLEQTEESELEPKTELLEPIELDADLPNSNDSELTVAESANNSPPPLEQTEESELEPKTELLEPIELDADLPNSNDSELTVAESANNSPPLLEQTEELELEPKAELLEPFTSAVANRAGCPTSSSISQ